MLKPIFQGIAWIMGLALLMTGTTAWAQSRLVFPGERRHIALDPGHGGDDTGATGPTGLLEKNVCLELARALALQLETRYQVTLTRSDDYHVQLRQRTAIANQAGADLYISLHTGAGFLHAARGTVIYYHAPDRKTPQRPTDNSPATQKPLPWRQVQLRHHASSQALANALKPHLEKLPEIQDVRVVDTPLAPLEGADMPAVLIELGHITNPATEQRMASAEGIAALARALGTGLEAYIQSQASESR